MRGAQSRIPPQVLERLGAVGVGVDDELHSCGRSGPSIDLVRSRRSGDALISSAVPVRAAASKSAARSTA